MARLHRFQGEHPEVGFTAPHWGGQGRYIARIAAGTIPGESREVTVSSADLAGLMDQLDDYLPPGDSKSGPGADLMEPAVERREHPAHRVLTGRVVEAAMEPAVERREHRPTSAAATARTWRRNGARR